LKFKTRQLHIQETDACRLTIAFAFGLRPCSGDSSQDGFLAVH